MDSALRIYPPGSFHYSYFKGLKEIKSGDRASASKLEKIKKSLEQKIAYRKWEDIIAVVNNINPKKEKEELLRNFDKIFLMLFPDFVQGFNGLFREEDQVQLKDHELLNTDLRIFALIRMA